MISIKIYKQGKDVLIGACDENLIGKKFTDGKFVLDIRKDFYEGKRITIKILKKYLENATIANLVGKNTVNCAIEMGLIDPLCVLNIKGIPHAQMVKFFC
jgi:hypothetical protein